MSRPAGARGLKHASGLEGLEDLVSRPAGARGLKQAQQRLLILLCPSRPAGARGLKHLDKVHVGISFQVAPRRGAWIETTGANGQHTLPSASRPAGARGLKQLARMVNTPYRAVAPRRGAWIETRLWRTRPREITGRAPQGRVD